MSARTNRVADTVVTSSERLLFEMRRNPDRPWREGSEDPLWRICNLYMLQNEAGEVVKFIPTEEQILVLVCIYIRGWLRIILVKSRQLGMSALMSIIFADRLAFQAGFNGALIDKTKPDAEKKLEEKVELALDTLPEIFRQALEIRTTTDSVVVRLRDGDEAVAPAQFEASINFRGGTVNALWVSEWGVIQEEDPGRSKKIKEGALPAVERAADGLCVVETTWKGGLDGDIGPYILEAQSTPPELAGPKTWRYLFFPWWGCPLYRQTHGYLDEKAAAYFLECEKRGIFLDQEQKLWYAEKLRTATTHRALKEEYPTWEEECWESIPPGSIYGEEIAVARTQRRVIPFFTDSQPVHTFWDCGAPINTPTIFAQITPQEIRIVDCIMEQDITLEERAELMRIKGYRYGFHYLPWEVGEVRDGVAAASKHYRKVLGENVIIVPKPRTVWDGIAATKAIFGRFVFHAERCVLLLEHLTRYRFERETVNGVSKEHPVHDKYSHVPDALRQLGQAIEAGKVPYGGSVGAVVTRGGPKPVVRRAL